MKVIKKILGFPVIIIGVIFTIIGLLGAGFLWLGDKLTWWVNSNIIWILAATPYLFGILLIGNLWVGEKLLDFTC